MLIQLVYVSNLVGEDESVFAPILDACTRNNTANRVTGMLLYSAGKFMQVLEGERAAVLGTFARIRQDKRHSDILMLSLTETEQREFGNWTMGFRALTHDDVQRLPDCAPCFRYGFDADALQAQSGSAMALLKIFRDTAR